jgi:ribosome assembly protein RRB1
MYMVGQVTSVSWHPTDASVLAVAGEDDVVSIWDLSVEPDKEAAKDPELAGIPHQLLFEHQVSISITHFFF